MAKHNKGNKTPAAQNTNTAQSAVASAWQKATAGVGSIASLVQSDVSVVTLPDLDKDQVNALDKAEPEKKVEIEKLLSEISDVARRFRDLHDDVQKRTDDLARKEEAFSRRSDENNDLSTLFRTHDYAAFFMASKTSGASFPLAE